MTQTQTQTQTQEVLFEAINEYSVFSEGCKKLLIALIKMSVDEIVVSSILELSKLTKTSRPSVYSHIKSLEQFGIIERKSNSGNRTTSFLLKSKKYKEILDHYYARKNLYTN